MIQHSTVEWSAAQCVGDGLAAAPDVIKAATPEKKVNKRIMKPLEKSGAFA